MHGEIVRPPLLCREAVRGERNPTRVRPAQFATMWQRVRGCARAARGAKQCPSPPPRQRDSHSLRMSPERYAPAQRPGRGGGGGLVSYLRAICFSHGELPGWKAAISAS